MKMQKCKSSNIDSFGWENGELEVKFNSGETYRYHKVPHIHFRKMKECVTNGLSVGSYFSANVKKAGYIYEKLPIDYTPKETTEDQVDYICDRLKAAGIGYEESDESGEKRVVLNGTTISVLSRFFKEVHTPNDLEKVLDNVTVTSIPSITKGGITGGGGVKVK